MENSSRKSPFHFGTVSITEHMVTAKYGTRITNGPRVQMRTSGSKKPEKYTALSKEKLAEVKLPASFDKLKDDARYFYPGENISGYELVQTDGAKTLAKLREEQVKQKQTQLLLYKYNRKRFQISISFRNKHLKP